MNEVDVVRLVGQQAGGPQQIGQERPPERRRDLLGAPGVGVCGEDLTGGGGASVQSLVGEVVDEPGQVFAGALRGLLDRPAVARELVPAGQGVDGLLLESCDAFVGVLFVEQFDERPEDSGAAVGQRLVGVGHVEPAEHGGHQGGAGQAFQTGSDDTVGERPDVAVGVG
ncbi:hypothetical protein ACWDOR_16275 [Streptosporangium canum]